MYKISDGIFFIFHDKKLILWDYLNHEQYEIDEEYMPVIRQWGCGERSSIQDHLDKSLLELGILIDSNAGSDGNVWEWDCLSKIFHFGTKDIPITFNKDANPTEWVDEYLEYCREIDEEMPEMETKRIGKEIVLPDPDFSSIRKISLFDSLKTRKTSRNFDSKEISIQSLSNILFSTFGYFHGEWDELSENNMKNTAVRRTSPSGGGLQPSEAYVVVNHVKGLIPAIYFYNSSKNTLISINEPLSDKELSKLLWGQYYCSGMSFGIFITSRFDKVWWKYKHSRAYRNAILDVGHLSQTFHLLCTSEGLNSWLTGAFNDSAIENLLGIDGQKEAILFFVGAGIGSDSAFDELMYSRLQNSTK